MLRLALHRLPFFSIALATLLALPGAQAAPAIESHEKLLTLLATNDIHGGIEARTARDGKFQGGLDTWAGAVRAIREGISNQYAADRAGVLVLDAGDQFQGTLLSNFNEGRLALQALDRATLDAAVPGNHDYDFGPLGWLEDQPRAGQPWGPENDPRGALKQAIAGVRFPLLSANTYYKSSLRDWDGNPVEVDAEGCAPRAAGAAINFLDAERPDFLKPYIITEKAGLRVALIGLDHQATASMTTQANVSDLCFRGAADTYIELRQQLEGRADIFVLVIHGGNAAANSELSHLVESILAGLPDKSDALHAVVAGHTHMVHRDWVQGIPLIQSGSGGELFGRVDLIWNTETRRIDITRTRAMAGIRLLHHGCSPQTDFQCREEPETGSPVLEGVRLEKDAVLSDLIEIARAELAPTGDRILARALKPLGRDRINESVLANTLNDALLAASGAEISLLNTGGIRDSLPAGNITYEEFFRVLPFNNRAVILGRFPVRRLIQLLEKSIRTCGDYGALLPGGLRVEFERTCSAPGPGTPAAGIDEKARLLRVVLAPSGEVLFDDEKGFQPAPERTLTVATLDFLAAGGSAYSEFAGAEISRDLGIFRELLVDELLRNHPELKGDRDGRWKNRH